ncbi:zinc finger protein 507 isoform X1 [Rana temporaria]|uniref:zinc finger protein 507 isoform X1 n=1 Tax=Rana temporaria TaxID=8407 RepID=UPI001AAD8150|nr:zinc finger protein 507 isoform X1 [Rana temporaria]XP_040185431.1 zinc finger protein 507 isoform X1 [Rana temporaria]
MDDKESGIPMSSVDVGSDDRVTPDARIHTKPEMKQKCNDPLISVIQKLTAMVKGEETARALEGKKRSYPVEEEEVQSVSKMADLPEVGSKRVKEETTTNTTESPSQSSRKVMFYQCSLCKFVSPSFETLAAHVKSHGQQNEIILMCSECHMTFKSHSELEAHIKTHCEMEVAAPSQGKDQPQEDKPLSPKALEPARKKWYAYEAYGLYRCLICRYTCGQQRMLKTHAWKHAGEVDCSYPIFEEENESASLPDSTVAHTPQGSESVLSENADLQQHEQSSGAQEQSVVPKDVPIKEVETLSQSAAPLTEVIVVDDATPESDQDSFLRESLLSSAQKIISCSQNTKGHVNVIVERLPSAEENGSPKPFLLNADDEIEKKLDSHLGASVELENVVESEEIIIGWSNPVKNGSDFGVTDENSPPVRRRTNSECLRLHSLAAEALVTMPIQIVECPKSSLRLIHDPDPIDPDTGQRDADQTHGTCPKVESSKVPEELNQKSELTQIPMKAGISTSLLKVIEKLRERTDQNATDDDILKELQDNAQSENASDLGSGNGLVEYLPRAERPFRCRLCHYTSDNKGYIKQHLRVHRQRQPYQCPICDHIAENSGDLENHMINHCKAIKYECKNCNESFYYKSQLRTHEREHRKLLDSGSSASDDAQLCTEETEESFSLEGGNKSSMTKVYRCDVCSYTSPTYVGVRNHIRIHTSDKPYRCSLCGYVCSHPPSLKSHMWKHASDQNYNYEQVNKAINEAMSQSTRLQQDPLKKQTPEDFSTAVDSDPPISASRPAAEASYVENQSASLSQGGSCSAEKLQGQMRPDTELCVLLFCCCICGFESTSKELLMEHMKAHEGEIINIILNKSESTS